MNDAPNNHSDSADLRETDAQAVMDHFLTGKPLDPSVAERVRVRSEKVTADIYRRFGELDAAVKLVREGRDEE